MLIKLKTTLVIFVAITIPLVNCDDNDTIIIYEHDEQFDYELYFEYGELNTNQINFPQKVNSTTEILFQPCMTSNGSIGILTRIRDCEIGISLERFYYNSRGLYYRIGCCTLSELSVDYALILYYYNLLQVFSNQTLQFDTITFTIPEVDGERCETVPGSRGIKVTHKRCKSLIGYIEKSDRHFELAEVPNGCCPARVSGQYYFDYIQHNSSFDHTICEKFESSNECPAEICLYCRQKKNYNMPKRPRHPYLAKLGNVNDGVYSWDCSGAIISPTFILTTSQCLTSDQSPTIVSVGSFAADNSLGKFPTCCSSICFKINAFYYSRTPYCACCPEILGIEKLIPFKSRTHNIPNVYEARYHDIGLVKLKTAIVITSYVHPAILPQSWYFSPQNMITVEFCTITQHEIDEPPYFHAKIMSSSKCVQYFEKHQSIYLPDGFMPKLQHCANVSRIEEVCDHGSVMVNRQSSVYETPMFVIHGISSFVDTGEENSDKVVVYTRVSNYLNWIEKKVWG